MKSIELIKALDGLENVEVEKIQNLEGVIIITYDSKKMKERMTNNMMNKYLKSLSDYTKSIFPDKKVLLLDSWFKIYTVEDINKLIEKLSESIK